MIGITLFLILLVCLIIFIIFKKKNSNQYEKFLKLSDYTNAEFTLIKGNMFFGSLIKSINYNNKIIELYFIQDKIDENNISTFINQICNSKRMYEEKSIVYLAISAFLFKNLNLLTLCVNVYRLKYLNSKNCYSTIINSFFKYLSNDKDNAKKDLDDIYKNPLPVYLTNKINEVCEKIEEEI